MEFNEKDNKENSENNIINCQKHTENNIDYKNYDNNIGIDEPHVFSKNSDERMKRYFKKKRKECNPIYKFAKNGIAMIIVIAIGILTIFGEKSEAVLFVMPPFVMESFDDFVKIRYGDKVQSSEYKPTKIDVFNAPSYLPKGFKEVGRMEYETIMNVQYYNEKKDKYIDYGKYLASTYLDVDLPENGYKEIVHDNSRVFCTSSEGSSLITWYREGYQYVIAGQESVKQLLKMKKSIDK